MWARASGIDSFKKSCSSASWDSQLLREASWPLLPNPPIIFQASAACEELHLLDRLTKQKVTKGNLALAEETNIICNEIQISQIIKKLSLIGYAWSWNYWWLEFLKQSDDTWTPFKQMCECLNWIELGCSPSVTCCAYQACQNNNCSQQ